MERPLIWKTDRACIRSPRRSLTKTPPTNRGRSRRRCPLLCRHLAGKDLADGETRVEEPALGFVFGDANSAGDARVIVALNIVHEEDDALGRGKLNDCCFEFGALGVLANAACFRDRLGCERELSDGAGVAQFADESAIELCCSRAALASG